MSVTDIPLFSMLRGRLGWLSDRQRVISENVANSDTPGYVPRDLKAFKIPGSPGSAGAMSAPRGVPLAMTEPGHLPGPDLGKPSYRADKKPDSETTLDGNAVVLEEQMVKLTDARMDYDAAIGFYQKALGMLKLAAGRPGMG